MLFALKISLQTPSNIIRLFKIAFTIIDKCISINIYMLEYIIMRRLIGRSGESCVIYMGYINILLLSGNFKTFRLKLLQLLS